LAGLGAQIDARAVFRHFQSRILPFPGRFAGRNVYVAASKTAGKWEYSTLEVAEKTARASICGSKPGQ